MFIPALHSGFGAPIGPIVHNIAAFGYRGVRAEQGVSLDLTAAVAEEILFAGMTPIVIVFQPEHIDALPDVPILLCPDNEPDLADNHRPICPRTTAMEPGDYLGLVHRICERAKPAHLVCAGEVSNPNARGRAFMEAIVPHLPSRVDALSWHRYPAGGRSEGVMVPHDGFANRAAETEYLWRMSGDRMLAITEGGYHTGARGGTSFIDRWLGRKPRRWSEDDIVHLWHDEWAFWARAEEANPGKLLTVVRYQINDGPSDHYLDRFGIRYADGSWKPSAQMG